MVALSLLGVTRAASFLLPGLVVLGRRRGGVISIDQFLNQPNRGRPAWIYQSFCWVAEPFSGLDTREGHLRDPSLVLDAQKVSAIHPPPTQGATRK